MGNNQTVDYAADAELEASQKSIKMPNMMEPHKLGDGQENSIAKRPSELSAQRKQEIRNLVQD